MYRAVRFELQTRCMIHMHETGLVQICFIATLVSAAISLIRFDNMQSLSNIGLLKCAVPGW